MRGGLVRIVFHQQGPAPAGVELVKTNAAFFSSPAARRAPRLKRLQEYRFLSFFPAGNPFTIRIRRTLWKQKRS
jgi:hypothetical protein